MCAWRRRRVCACVRGGGQILPSLQPVPPGELEKLQEPEPSHLPTWHVGARHDVPLGESARTHDEPTQFAILQDPATWQLAALQEGGAVGGDGGGDDALQHESPVPVW